LADGRADAEAWQAVSIDHDQASILHAHQAARRAEVIHARQESPGATAVIAVEHLGPHVAGGISLAAQCAQDAAIWEQRAARVEPAVAAVGEAAGLAITFCRFEGIAFRRDETHEVEFGATVEAAIDQRTAIA